MAIRIEKQHTVSVLGLGRSGMAVIEYLRKKGIAVYAFDDGMPSEAVRARLCALDVPLYARGVGEVRGDFVFRAPVIRPDAPRLCRAALRGARILSEAEFFLSLCPAPVYAVTGSDGKTTTASLLASLLARTGRCVYLGGNIGKSLLPSLDGMTENDLCVMELSSFQLSDMKASVACGVITNLSPNHLNWHRDMAEYTASKERLLGMAHKRVLRQGLFPAADAVRFSADTNAAYTLREGRLYGRNVPLCAASELRLAGKHNVENLLAASAAAESLITPADVRFVARTFTGVPHRMEYVCEKNGVRFYNSSIDTTPSRTCVTLAAMQNSGRRILLLCGGAEKGLSFEVLADAIRQSGARAYLFGEAREKIALALLKNGISYTASADMKTALSLAYADAQKGDIILLSPACTSFDAFTDFEARGACFRREADLI